MRFDSAGVRLACIVVPMLVVGCTTDEPAPDSGGTSEPTWSRVASTEASALLSVHGPSPDDVWVVGADDGEGPMVLHWDGDTWARMPTGMRGDLWWVHTFDDGTVFMGGGDALTLRYENGMFTRMPNPGLGKDVVFGLWGSDPTDLYAVGSSGGRNGFVWHSSDGETWTELALPEGITQNAQKDLPIFTKVWGRSADEVWVVGGGGTVLRGNARDGFEVVPTESSSLIFTVHGAGDRVLMVGGGGTGLALEVQGSTLSPVTPTDAPLLQGVGVGTDAIAWACGIGGVLYRGDDTAWAEIDHGLILDIESLHAVWIDPAGGVWSVGGNVLTDALDQGVVIHTRDLPAVTITPEPPAVAMCPEEAVDPTPDRSIARRWNEQLLNAIRRDTPRPGVHARNLFHTSAAMWDGWAVYDDTADGVLTTERIDVSSMSAAEVQAAREETISYAAYRVLSHRYGKAIGGDVSTACFDAFMGRLGYDPSDTSTEGDGARAVGNRIGAALVAHWADDGANEANNYADPDDWLPTQPKLVVDLPGTAVDDPTQWQQLILAEAVTQNGIPEGSGGRGYIGGHWGAVEPFAMVRPEPGKPYYDIGEPPVALDDALVAAAVQVIRRTAWLDVDDGTTIDISPGAIGNNPLGSDSGAGYDLNPMTGEAYAPVMVKRGDFGRVLAEFWADGPASETPPGHWNTLANYVADHDSNPFKLFGDGEPLDPLAWDVHVYLALNGAVHDAAVSAWELKRTYTSARPITLIRYMGGLGQRSDPAGPSYHPEGLPLEPGLIEVITAQTSAAGERHAHLARYVGEIAVRSWRGEPGDRDNAIGGVGWIRAKDWIPYQRRTFVTPAFPGYVSGHSTFSRAAAEVLAEVTGSPYFPGGLGHYSFEPGYLFFEAGPSEPVDLQWATYADAADQAGQSRLWGGIHVVHDDFDGRRVGSLVGKEATALARSFFDGTAR